MAAPPAHSNPCMACGACCAAFRVSFYWAEAEATGLPPDMMQPLNAVMACMAGTNQASPRCAALEGKIGVRVACGTYEQRPSPCRGVDVGDEKCSKARARHGLAPLAPR